MRFVVFIAAAVTLLVLNTQGAFRFDTLKVGSTVYSNVTVLSLNPTDVHFQHSAGMANAKLRLLEPEAQRVLGYDPAKSAQAEQQRGVAEQAYQARIVPANPAAGAGATTPGKRQSAEERLSDPISPRSLLNQAGPLLNYSAWPELAEAPSGKHVLLVFWTAWSLPSAQSLPGLSALQKKFAGQMVVLGLNPDPAPGETEVKTDFPTAPDPAGKIAEAAGATSVPFVLLMNPAGKVLYQGHPGALTEAKVGKLLAMQDE
jgi:thiol-disulfide isomerase/thioredoxin